MMADRIRSWFLQLSPEMQKELLQKLLDCDKERRVDYQEGLAMKIESDMISMMNQLRELIEKENPLFEGRMMQCGSSYNQTKIGLPDEMDFAFQWDLSETRSRTVVSANFSFDGPKQCERLRRDDILPDGIVPVDQVDLTFSFNRSDNANDVVHGIRPSNIHGRFVEAVNASLMKMTLLPDWEHGGFASPDCTGTRENGPALMLQFNYNQKNGDKLKMTVDLVLAIDLREIYDGDLEEVCAVQMGPTWQQELLKKKKFLDKVLTKIHQSVHLDTTFAERVWLSTMDIDHPVKISVRILKIINQMALQHPDPDMKIDSFLFTVDKIHMAHMKFLRKVMANYAASEDRERSKKLAMNKLRERQVKQLQYFDMKVPEGERFVDLGECLGHRPYLKSHVFQSVVLALYALRCTQHPEIAEDNIWSKDDVPTIVGNVLMVIQHFLDTSKDEDPDPKGFRSWNFCSIELESEGRRYSLPNPNSLCLEVYRRDTVKQHFARMWHLFQQLTNHHGADGDRCLSHAHTTGQDEGTPPTETDKKVVHLLPINLSK